MTTPKFELPTAISQLPKRAADLAREAWGDRRAVTGAVAALGVGLLLGVAMKPAVALEAKTPAAGQGLAVVEPGRVDTDGLDLIVTARASDEGRLPTRTTMLPSPVLADPGPAPRLYRASYAPAEPEIAELSAEDVAFISDAMPPCAEDCVAAIRPVEFR
jgi:hypothetical protein